MSSTGTDSLRAVRQELSRRLRARQPETEREVSARIQDLPEAAASESPEYEHGLRAAVAESLGFGILCIEMGDEWCVPAPMAVVAQARRAAREGVSLATVLRRYSAGNMLFEEHILAAAEGLPTAAVLRILHEQVPHVDRLIGAVADNYAEALRKERGSTSQRRAERLEHLLNGNAGGSVDDINYDFDVWHVGAVLVGVDAGEAAQTMSVDGGMRMLAVKRDRATAWLWLGSSQRPAMGEIESWLVDTAPSQTSVALGTPHRGLDGWRLTHREARAAVQVVLRRPSRLTRACDVALLVGMLKDETLVRSLISTYLAPLERQPESGQVLRETVRAYLEAGCNAAAAAPTLNVHRHTVQRRIRTVEGLIGKLLPHCYAELQVALQLAELDPDACAAQLS